MKNEKTSLERSHSKLSNTKLTFLCIVSVLLFSLFWGILALKDEILAWNNIAFYGSIAGDILFILLCFLGFRKFKR